MPGGLCSGLRQTLCFHVLSSSSFFMGISNAPPVNIIMPHESARGIRRSREPYDVRRPGCDSPYALRPVDNAEHEVAGYEVRHLDGRERQQAPLEKRQLVTEHAEGYRLASPERSDMGCGAGSHGSPHKADIA